MVSQPDLWPVIVTRAEPGASETMARLKTMGLQGISSPMLELAPLDVALPDLSGIAHLVFTSANGVEHFFDYFFKAFCDVRDLGSVRFAAVGPATANKLRELHIHVDLMPEVHTAEAAAKALLEFQNVENISVLLPRAEEANPELPRLLEDQGAIVDDIAFYKTVPETADRTGAAEEFEEHGADWITFASGSAVRHFDARFGLAKCCENHPGLKLASIGPETTKALNALGLQPAVEAREHTIDGLANALLEQ